MHVYRGFDNFFHEHLSMVQQLVVAGRTAVYEDPFYTRGSSSMSDTQMYMWALVTGFD